MRAVGADRGGVEVAVAIDFRAADESGLNVAALQQTHEIDRARAPHGSGDVRRIAHGVEELRRRLVADDAELEQADGVRRVRASSPQLDFVWGPGKSFTPTMYATHA